jgi:hypothetical protein
MIKTLFFLEDPKEIDRIVLDGAKNHGQSVYIPLTPSASYAFEKSNIPYKSIRDYGGGEERYQQGMENFQRIERIVTILDKELTQVHEIRTLTPARYSIYNLKILFDVLWSAIHILKRIIEKEHPDFIRLYASPQSKSDQRTYAFSNDESVYAEILKMSGWNIPIEIIRKTNPEIPGHRFPGRKKTAFYHFRSWIREQDLIFNLGLINQRVGFVSAITALCYDVFSRHRKPVLIYNSGYNWDDSLVELYRAGMVPVHRISDETFDKVIPMDTIYQEEVRKVCNIHPGIREFDQILGIEVSAFFFERFSHIIGRSIQESFVVYPLACKLIHKKKIRGLLHSVRERAIGHAIIQAAHDEGIPVISWQHGGAGYCYHPMMPFIEFINSDRHFVFGEGVARSYSSTSIRIRLEKIPIFVPVGSSSLDTFYRSGRKTAIKQANKPVVYISTAYLRNIYTLSQPFDPIEWDEHLWNIQKQIIDLAKKNPEKEFIIKLHPMHRDKEPLLSYVKDKEIKNVRIITSEMTVRELTNIADLVIFDLISTGILQVLTSDLPVFIYTGLYGIDPDMIRQLKKRAYVNDNIENFLANIDEYIKTKRVMHSSVDNRDMDFLSQYGTYKNRYQSAFEAVTRLEKILP